jgi:flagellar hook-associated protein 3 FlgL
MRIATTTMFQRGLAAIDQAQQNLSKVQQQVSTGKKVNVASDDPIAATQILRTTSGLANNTQYIANQGVASQLLGQTDSTLGQVTDLLQSVRTTIVSANNGTLSDSERASLSTELKSRIDSLVGLANTQDGDGNYLFGGYRTDTTPFTRTSSGASYAGDDGNRSVQVSGTRQLTSTVNGNDVFNRISEGNGVFTTAAASGNTGSGIVDVGQVVTPSALTGHNYNVSFAVSGGVTTYSVLDTTTNTAVAAPALTGNTFTSGSAITVDGAQLTISVTPASGDQFTIAPAGKQSIFQALQAAADLLAQPTTTSSGGTAKLSSGLLGALSNVDNALNKTLSVRATVGVRQNELDALGSSASATDIAGQARLSDLQNTDYAKAIADLTEQQTALSAAQKTFATIGNKTLFDYL